MHIIINKYENIAANGRPIPLEKENNIRNGRPRVKKRRRIENKTKLNPIH